MKSLFGEVLADDAVAVNAEPHAELRYYVATWYVPDKEWKVWWREIHLTRSDAVGRASDLCQVRGHTHYTVLEVRLPGIRGGGESAATGLRESVVEKAGIPEGTQSETPLCPTCGGQTTLVQVPCPDGKPGCLVLHQECWCSHCGRCLRLPTLASPGALAPSVLARGS